MMRFLLVILAALLIAAPAAAHDKRVALTFDDVPRSAGAFMSIDERTETLIAALDRAGVEQAAFFLNPCRLNKPSGVGGEERIAAYVAAGHVIANHTCNHPKLSRTDTDSFLADIDLAAIWLKARVGYRPWFRFPYLDEGARDKEKRDAVRKGLSKRGLRNGYVTADGSDWFLEQLTVNAKKSGEQMDMMALRRLYVSSQMSGLEYHDELARVTLGRSPAHVMLLHETDLAALFIEDFVAEAKRRGWTIISADEAFDDPINQLMPDVPYAAGTVIGSAAWERDIHPPLSPVWMGTGTMDYLFKQRVIKRATSPKEEKVD